MVSVGSSAKQARYWVRQNGAEPCFGRLVNAESFIEAALLFVEGVAAQQPSLSVIVTDRQTGRSRCFQIDLDEIGGC